MSEMQSVGIRDFRANLHKYTVENQDPIAVTSHGRHIGYYIPAKPSPKEADFEALRTASRLLEAMLKKSGVTEDEIVAEFDALRKQERQKKSQP
ncbi:MAG: type II toxin-antitoxin system Phd/YefM family antitoxin [Symploca sp. SIO1B1]|nr:type II toxin-antitoxin system Phd/YefM family antitoxin [Symploca sp. SIO1C2]NER94738.1 type II toxin-antitoxin system Phd/YefM family antitoxin [Symploca sp. SIO1B1]